MVVGPGSRRLPALVEVVLIKSGSYLDARRSASERCKHCDEDDGASTLRCRVASRNLGLGCCSGFGIPSTHTISKSPGCALRSSEDV